MIKPGICSVTLQQYAPEEVLSFSAQNSLRAIEWWATGHVKIGELSKAEKIGKLTGEMGLEVASYGSYYRAGVSENSGMPFASVLETAAALGAPTIRVWAGDKNREDADRAFVSRVIEDANRIASLAAHCGISITFEFHGGSLTNSNANAKIFAREVLHPNVFFSWQPPHGFPLNHCLSGLEGLLGRLSTVHVYHWTIGSREQNLFNESEHPNFHAHDIYRHPLENGLDRWEIFLATLTKTGHDHCVLLEFVRDDCLEQAKADASVLVRACQAAMIHPITQPASSAGFSRKQCL